MSTTCCAPDHTARAYQNRSYRVVLTWALAINAVMFLVEISAGMTAGSVSLQADALDFLGDTANYAISLLVVGTALRSRATAALVKGTAMAFFGLWVLGSAVWHVTQGSVPRVTTMGTVGSLALVANGVVFALLWKHRSGDSNMRSVWLCTRNDVLGNLAVLGAAFGVFGTNSSWPDIAVATIMSGLALQGAWIVFRQAIRELS